MVDRSQYKVGVVTSISPCTSSSASSKKLRACQVKLSENDDDGIITVVTAATNVREGSRIVVAPVGSTVVDETGEDLLIQKTSVGGVMSEGMLCDARMLGWVGGAEGIAAQIPDSFPLGSAPPLSKPRTDNATSDVPTDIPAVEVKPLFEKKLTKEEKKKLADEKRKAKKAAKETNGATDTGTAEIDD